MSQSAGAFCLGLSIALHLALGGLLAVGLTRAGDEEEASGAWGGSAFETGTWLEAELVDGSTAGGSMPSEGAAPTAEGDDAQAPVDAGDAADPIPIPALNDREQEKGPELPSSVTAQGALTAASGETPLAGAQARERPRAKTAEGAGPGTADTRPQATDAQGGAEGAEVAARSGGPPSASDGGTIGDDARAPAAGEQGERAGLGGEAAAARVGQLPAAFTRALPAAARGDMAWHRLERGLAGRWLVRAQLDEAGALKSLNAESGEHSYLVRLLRVTESLLRQGRFALPQGSSGEHRLGLEIWIDDGDVVADGEPRHVSHLGSRYPTGSEPGEATVTFNSGRRVRLRVFIEPNW